ncbi:unnamed protein product [Discula destructiva]
MPSTVVHNSTQPGPEPSTTKGPADRFTGDVYADKIQMPAERSSDGIVCGHITFLPGARTFWHTHENGQILEVKAGSGWVCDRGGVPQRIRVGDIVTCSPGITHWHGADDGSMLMHLAIGLGKTTWLEEVTAEEYAKKGASSA